MSLAVTPRTIIVSDAPAQRQDPSRPLRGESGKRLAKLAQVSLGYFLVPFDVVNLVERVVRDDWPVEESEERAEKLRAAAIANGQRVVLLGRRVALSFGLIGPPCFEWVTREGFTFAYSPHPNGKGTWWNDADNVERATKFWRGLHREESEKQKTGVSLEKPPRRRGQSSHAGEPQRSEAEIAWMRDRVEDFYVEAMSASIASRSLVQLHATVCARGAELEHEGMRFTPARPVSKRHAAGLLADVFARWREHCLERVEDMRRSHHESVSARIVQAKTAGEWPTVARLHELLAQIDGIVGRPEERQASLQVSVQQSAAGGIDIYARMGDDELEHLAREALRLEARPVVVDAVGSQSESERATPGPR